MSYNLSTKSNKTGHVLLKEKKIPFTLGLFFKSFLQEITVTYLHTLSGHAGWFVKNLKLVPAWCERVVADEVLQGRLLQPAGAEAGAAVRVLEDGVATWCTLSRGRCKESQGDKIKYWMFTKSVIINDEEMSKTAPCRQNTVFRMLYCPAGPHSRRKLVLLGFSGVGNVNSCSMNSVQEWCWWSDRSGLLKVLKCS